MRVVSPYRPFAPESYEHEVLGPFDWPGALEMLWSSVVATNPTVDFAALTASGVDLPVPAFAYEPREHRLMLWLLDVALAYIESDDFDCDSVMICPDLLVVGSLEPLRAGDLGVLARPGKHIARGHVSLLNSVQFWRHAAKERLAAFYRRALEMARELPEDVKRWGADTVPLAELLSPVAVGKGKRCGLRVRFHDENGVCHSLRTKEIKAMQIGRPVVKPDQPIVDFRYLRKLHMRAYFDAIFGDA